MRELTCEEVQGKLDAYVDHDLAWAENEAVRRHLDACPACRREAEMLARADAMLRAPRPMAAPQSVRTAVYARIAAPEPPWWLRPASMRLAMASLCALAVVVGTAAVIVRMRPSAVRLPVDQRYAVRPAAPNKEPVVIPSAPALTNPTVSPTQQAAAPAMSQPSAQTPALHSTTRVVANTSKPRTPPTQAMPESFLDVADSRGITARQLMYPAMPAGSGTGRDAAMRPVRAEEVVHDRVQIGPNVLEIRGVAERDAKGRLMAIRVRAESAENAQPESAADGEG